MSRTLAALQLSASLALATGLLASCVTEAKPVQSGPVVRAIGASHRAFLPGFITAPPMTSVEIVFRNDSDDPHTFILLDPISLNPGEIVVPGESRTISFTTPGPGVYQFVCNVHEGMTGTLVVE